MSVAVDRLTVEAGKYNGLTAGATIDKREVVLQAEANGYTEREAHNLLEGKGQTVEIPEQGNLFGEQWPDNQNDSFRTLDNPCKNQNSQSDAQKIPEPLDGSTKDHYALHEPLAQSSNEVARERYLDDGKPMTAAEAIGQYFKRRTTDSTSRETQGFVNGRRGTAENQYKRGMALGRQCLDQFDNPTLVMLSLRVSPNPQNRLTLLSGLSDGVDAVRYKLRRRLEEDADAPLSSCEWEYVVVFAGTRKRATPHAHILVYVEGDVNRDRFDDVIDWYVKKCPYARDDGSGHLPDSDAISIHGNGDDEIPRVDRSSIKLQETVTGVNSQAAAYALKQLPHLGAVGSMELDELLHSVTHDAFSGSAFRSSVSEESIDSRYLPVSNNPCRNQTEQPTQSKSSSGLTSEHIRQSLISAVSQLAQIPTPQRRLETPIDDRIRASKGIFRVSANREN